MNEQGIRDVAADSIALKKRFFDENARLLMEVGGRMAECLRSGGKILTFGNGGSAADAQHLAGELVGRFLRDRPALAAIALTTDPSVITAVGNDMGYEAVFRRQVEAHGKPGDVAVGISTSGRSAVCFRRRTRWRISSARWAASTWRCSCSSRLRSAAPDWGVRY